jgi:peroxiredoxin/outer membrane lipoprotein-sorting protein
VRTRICAICVCLLFCNIARGDEAADKLLADYATRAKSLQTLTARIDLTWQTPGQPLKRNAGTLALLKPNYALINLSGDYPLITLASDGKSRYLLPDASKYTIANADASGKNIDTPWWALPVRFFFTQDVKPFGPDSPSWTSSRYAGSETIAQETYTVVEITGDKPMAYVTRLYFDRSKLLRRTVVRFGDGDKAATFTAQLDDVNTPSRLRPATFKFKPPVNAKLDTGAESRMLAIGDAGPEFSLPTPEGKLLDLATVRQNRKATLVNFWYLACPPCREEFSLFQRLYTDLKDQGFAIVAINGIDESANVKSYIKQTRISFPIVMGKDGSTLANYRIETYPSTYLLNSEGKVVYKSVGIDQPGLLRALKELGLQK